MPKDRLILSHDASLRLERDIFSLSNAVMLALHHIPGARATAWGGRYADAAWTKTPRRKIEVPDIYAGIEVNQDVSKGLAYEILAVYIEPSWRSVEQGEFVYTLTIFTGGAMRKSKAAPLVREDVIPGDNVRQYVARAWSESVTAHPVPRANGRRRRRR
jgi:hypothetical protein